MTLVDKKGRAIKKNIERFKDSILNNTNYTTAEKRMLIADIDVEVDVRKRNKSKLTTSGFMGMQEETSIARFFTNAGWSVEEFADEIDEDINDILNENNWQNGQLYINGRTFKFNWTYTGNLFEEI